MVGFRHTSYSSSTLVLFFLEWFVDWQDHFKRASYFKKAIRQKKKSLYIIEL